MFQESFAGGSIKAILNKSSHSKDKTKYLVSIQVTWSRVPIRYSTKVYLSVADYEILHTTKKRELTELRKDISVIYERLRVIIKDLLQKGTMSHAELKRQYANNGSSVNTRTISSMLDSKVKSLQASGKVSSANYYKYTKKKLETLKMDKVSIDKFDVSHVKRIDAAMRGIASDTYIAMTMRAIKHIVNTAKQEGLMPKERVIFGKGGYDIIEVQGVKKSLSKDEVFKIINYQAKENHLQFYKDMWVFMYLANGMNAADLCHLKYSNIEGNEIVFVRRKTKSSSKRQIPIRTFIHPIMQGIIEKWGTGKTYIFPLLKGTEQSANEVRNREIRIYNYINIHMKQIGKELNISNVTTYVARHSFATILKKSGVDISYISEQLGHSSVSMTQHYLDSFESDVRKNNSMLLTENNDNKNDNLM